MSEFNEKSVSGYLKFRTLEGIVDAEIYNLNTEYYYQIIEYDEMGLPIIFLPDGNVFGLILDELECVDFVDLELFEEDELDEDLKETLQSLNNIGEHIQYKFNNELASTDPVGDIMKNHFEEEINMLNSNNKKAVPTFKGGDKHELSEKEVKKISDGLDKLMLEAAINTALENNDFSALEKLSEVLRQESN